MHERAQIHTDAQVAHALPWPNLIEALDEAFRRGANGPARPHYTIGVPGEPDATLLLMPAWAEGEHIGIKTVTVFPGNAQRSLPSVSAQYMLISATTGALVAILQAGELTARRTAAASALASRYLSRRDARRLLVVGTGRLSTNLVAAHATVRTFDEVVIWGRDRGKAYDVAATLAAQGLPARAGEELKAEVRRADIVSCCTLARDPLVRGEWLKPGTHLDLVGAFTPAMREADDAALTRSRVFVDTFEGALAESGEMVQGMQSGALKREDVQASLFDLARGENRGRESAEEITLFKSVGCSLEDLAAAELFVARSSASAPTDAARG